MSRPGLTRRAYAGLLRFQVSLAVLIFLPAWSLRYWQGWLLWSLFCIAVTMISAYFLREDPALIERRLKAGPSAEMRPQQKVIQSALFISFIALVVFPGVDHRRGWSHISPYAVAAGDLLVVAGLLAIFFVFKENSYTSATIEVGQNQAVVSTGPYRYIRHPMYAEGLVLLAGIPLGLGSLWGLWRWLPAAAIIVARLLDEERYLRDQLDGYAQYCARTRFRLLPGIF